MRTGVELVQLGDPTSVRGDAKLARDRYLAAKGMEQIYAATLPVGDDVDSVPDIAAETGAKLHLYGKAEVKPGRKMGHVNRITG